MALTQTFPRAALLVASALLVTAPAGAQGPEGRVSLGEAIALARRQSPAREASATRVAAADQARTACLRHGASAWAAAVRMAWWLVPTGLMPWTEAAASPRVALQAPHAAGHEAPDGEVRHLHPLRQREVSDRGTRDDSAWVPRAVTGWRASGQPLQMGDESCEAPQVHALTPAQRRRQAAAVSRALAIPGEPAVREAIAAGVDAERTFDVGGKTDAAFGGGPVRVHARVAALSPALDLALLQVSNPDPRQPVLSLGKTARVQAGKEVVAIGYALGTLSNTVTRGIVSAVRRVNTLTLLQIDAAINPGNSGGPLIDRTGTVIGINTLGASGQGLGFAVAAEHADHGALHQNLGEDVGRAGSDGLQRLRFRPQGVETVDQVLDEVARAFDARRQPDQRVGQAEGVTRGSRNRRVRHLARQAHQRAHAAEAFAEREVLAARHEGRRLVQRAVELEADHAAESRHLRLRDLESFLGVFGEEDFVAAGLEAAREEDAVVLGVIDDEEFSHGQGRVFFR